MLVFVCIFEEGTSLKILLSDYPAPAICRIDAKKLSFDISGALINDPGNAAELR
jgi:hypothetical protein